jgi:hypothetical protein
MLVPRRLHNFVCSVADDDAGPVATGGRLCPLLSLSAVCAAFISTGAVPHRMAGQRPWNTPAVDHHGAAPKSARYYIALSGIRTFRRLAASLVSLAMPAAAMLAPA